jgi:hypothetical protein
MRAKRVRRTYTFEAGGETGEAEKVVILGGHANHYAVWPAEEEVRAELARTHGPDVRITAVQDFTDEIDVPD